MIFVPEGADASAQGLDCNTGLQGNLVFPMVYKGYALTVLAVFYWHGPKPLFSNGFRRVLGDRFLLAR